MTLRTLLAPLLLVTLALHATGCPDDGEGGYAPRAACEDLAAGVCERLYACLSAEEIAAGGLPATEEGCVAMLEADGSCDQLTLDNACDEGQVYSEDTALTCIDQVAAITCPDLRTTDLEVLAPACEQVCQ